MSRLLLGEDAFPGSIGECRKFRNLSPSCLSVHTTTGKALSCRRLSRSRSEIDLVVDLDTHATEQPLTGRAVVHE